MKFTTLPDPPSTVTYVLKEVPEGTEFSLIAEDGEAEAVCAFPAGATARLGSERIVPPWAV